MRANNSVIIRGVIGHATFDYASRDIAYYTAKIYREKGNTGTVDDIPVIMTHGTLRAASVNMGDSVECLGEFRTKNVDGKSTQYIFCTDLKKIDSSETQCATICIIGKYNSKPFYTERYFTTIGAEKKLASVTLEVECNRRYFIPVIFWGRGADVALSYTEDDRVHIEGFLNVRTFKYFNKETGDTETRSQLEVIAVNSKAI